jgi:hypothetical protein
MASTTQIQTPYASFSTMSRDISVNGGAWYTSSNPTGTLAGQQSVGDLTGFIKLRGWMYSAVVIPEDIAKAGDTITTYVFFLFYSLCSIIVPSLSPIYLHYTYLPLGMRYTDQYIAPLVCSTLRYNACGIRGDTDSRTTTTLKGSTVSFCPTSENSWFYLSTLRLDTFLGNTLETRMLFHHIHTKRPNLLLSVIFH